MSFDLGNNSVTVDKSHDDFFTNSDSGKTYKETGSGTRPQSKSGDSADEVDPRKLVRTPTIRELRWYYRRTFAETIVNKPVKDAFKHGFSIEGNRNVKEIGNLLEEIDYIPHYARAQIKARRDGFCLLFIGFKQNNGGKPIDLSNQPQNVIDVSHVKVLTIDDLREVGKSRISDQIELPEEKFEVRDTGVVINKDLQSEDFNEPLGYVLDSDTPQFIHRDRVQHFTWNKEVDGDYNKGNRTIEDGRRTLGRWEGDSVLMSSYDLLKWLKKGNWSIMQQLFRYASKLYSVKAPDNVTDEEWDELEKEMRNLNSKSELMFPSKDYEIKDFQTDGQLTPQEHFDVIFDQICAGNEMTKSVLFGTQQGTVTGSETDIKNYFNKVERMREGRFQKDILSFIERVAKVDTTRRSEVISNFALDSLEINWNPLFKLNKLDRLEAFRTQSNALTMMVNDFALTPNEVREILSQQWAFVDLDDLTEQQKDLLDRINRTQAGSMPESEGGSGFFGNPRKQNGGGRQQGESSESNQPASDSIDVSKRHRKDVTEIDYVVT